MMSAVLFVIGRKLFAVFVVPLLILLRTYAIQQMTAYRELFLNLMKTSRMVLLRVVVRIRKGSGVTFDPLLAANLLPPQFSMRMVI